MDFWDLASLTSWTCWCHFIGKLAEQRHFKEPDFPVCVWSSYISLLRGELASEGGRGFLHSCVLPTGVLRLTLLMDRSASHSLSSLPSKNIQGGTTWLLISGDENIWGPQMTDGWWSIDRTDLEQRSLSWSQRVCNINCFYILGFVLFSFGIYLFFNVHSVQSKEGDLRYWL